FVVEEVLRGGLQTQPHAVVRLHHPVVTLNALLDFGVGDDAILDPQIFGQFVNGEINKSHVIALLGNAYQ
ncbi:MAG: hypothetical protein VW976_08295, partial [Flavobacteriaceae bacterium]